MTLQKDFTIVDHSIVSSVTSDKSLLTSALSAHVLYKHISATMNKTRSATASASQSLTDLTKLTAGQKNKRFRTDEGMEIESLTDLWTNMKELHAETNNRLEEKLDAFKLSIDGLETKFERLQKDIEEKVGSIKEAVVVVQADLSHTSEKVDRLEKLNELIFSGIPYLENENLLVLFQAVAACLGYGPQHLPLVDLKRLAKPPIVVGTSPPILCQFALRNTRDDFLKRYLTNRNLTLRHVGFDVDSRIFINENLTPLAREIRAAALKLRKAGRLQQVYTRDGIVVVKRLGSTQPESILCHDQLQRFGLSLS